MILKKLNMNDCIRVKLTDHGKYIYYHRFDDAIRRGLRFKREYPKVDSNGFTTFQLWHFIELYGRYISITQPNVVEDISFYINPEDLDDVEIKGEPQDSAKNT